MGGTFERKTQTPVLGLFLHKLALLVPRLPAASRAVSEDAKSVEAIQDKALGQHSADLAGSQLGWLWSCRSPTRRAGRMRP
jgi:hypothetical protein